MSKIRLVWLLDGMLIAVVSALSCYVRVQVLRPGSAQDLTPFPEPVEYALASAALARGEGLTVWLFDRPYPMRFSPGLAMLLAPWHYLCREGAKNAYLVVMVLGALTPSLAFLGARFLTNRIGALAAGVIVAFSGIQINWCRYCVPEPVAGLLMIVVFIGMAALFNPRMTNGKEAALAPPPVLPHQGGGTKPIRHLLLGLMIGFVAIMTPGMIFWSMTVVLLAVYLIYRASPASLGSLAALSLGIMVPLGLARWFAWRSFGTPLTSASCWWRPDVFTGWGSMWPAAFLGGRESLYGNFNYYGNLLLGKENLDFWQKLYDHRAVALLVLGIPAGFASWRAHREKRLGLVLLMANLFSIGFSLLFYREANSRMAMLFLPWLAIAGGVGAGWLADALRTYLLAAWPEFSWLACLGLVLLPVFMSGAEWYQAADRREHGPGPVRTQLLKTLDRELPGNSLLISDLPPPMVHDYFLMGRPQRKAVALEPAFHLEWALKFQLPTCAWDHRRGYHHDEPVVYQPRDGGLQPAAAWALIQSSSAQRPVVACLHTAAVTSQACQRFLRDFTMTKSTLIEGYELYLVGGMGGERPDRP